MEVRSKIYSKALDSTIETSRVIGSLIGKKPGPTLIFTGGMHGNEPSGVIALKKVFDQLNEIPELEAQTKGSIYAIAGNLPALEKGVRFINKDLNRLWLKEQIDQLEVLNGSACSDEKEQKEIFTLLQNIVKENRGPFYFIDLHTTSSETSPFILINDTLINRDFARHFPLPIILGIEEYLDGPLLSYINEVGHIALGFESGQHDDLSAIENHIAFIWTSMCYTGCLKEEQLPDFEHQYNILHRTSLGFPSIFEIRYKYTIGEQEDFNMQPGYVNFQKVVHGEMLAFNQQGSILANERGRVFMPLYQKQGRDGFFIIREVSEFWLKLSATLRKLKIESLLPLLPGVKKVNGQSHALQVNKSVARFLAKDFFHLLGYRRKKRVENKMYFIKREYDIKSIQ